MAGAIAAAHGHCPLGKWGEPPPPSSQGPAWLIQPDRGPVDVVYFLGSESKHQDWELRYSLRSVAKHFKDLGQVYVIGYKPPWLTGVVHVPMPDKHKHNKDANLIDKLVEAYRWGVSPWYLNISDDQILLKPVRFADCKAYHGGDLATMPVTFWSGHKWKDRLRRTMNHLVGRGLPAFHHDCHAPFPIHAETFARVAREVDYATPPGFTIHTLYGNSAPIHREPIGRRKVTYEHACYLSFNIAKNLDEPEALFLGYSDSGMTPQFMDEIEYRFKEPSPWEADRRRPIAKPRPSPAAIHLPDVPTVVYTVPRATDRHPRVKAILDAAGFSNWQFFYGQNTRPYWTAIPHDHARLLREHEPPFLILEDDIAVRDFHPWVEPPPAAEIVYLGAGRSRRRHNGIAIARQHLPGHRILQAHQYGYEDLGPDWMRVFNMLYTHAILYLDKRVMLEVAEALDTSHVPIDWTLAQQQWRWQTVCRKIPMWWQNDNRHREETFEYGPNAATEARQRKNRKPARSETILLTSCVRPAAPVAVASPQDRLAELLAAVELWRGSPTVGRIIVADASGFTPPAVPRGIEWHAWDLSRLARDHGKGRAEAELLARTVARCQPDAFWKITGRLFVTNFAALGRPQGAALAAFDMPPGIDTRCFYATRPAFETLLAPRLEEIDDRHRESWIEAVYGRVAADSAARLTAPRYMGRSGTTGRRCEEWYPSDLLARAQATARSWLSGTVFPTK
jgi:hypothetical protein